MTDTKAAREAARKARLDQIPKRAYLIDEFCKACGVSRATTYRMIREGRLPSVTIAGRRLIPVDAAEALLTGNPQKGREPDAA